MYMVKQKNWNLGNNKTCFIKTFENKTSHEPTLKFNQIPYYKSFKIPDDSDTA